MPHTQRPPKGAPPPPRPSIYLSLALTSSSRVELSSPSKCSGRASDPASKRKRALRALSRKPTKTPQSIESYSKSQDTSGRGLSRAPSSTRSAADHHEPMSFVPVAQAHPDPRRVRLSGSEAFR